MTLIKRFTLGYLTFQFFYRIYDFLYNWYVRTSKRYWHFVFNRLEDVDRTLALKTTTKLWFQPLYGDYSFLGYILGFFFRTMRIIIGLVIHTTLIIISLAVFIIWIIMPVIMVYGVLTGENLLW